jgi:hypothetical protein
MRGTRNHNVANSAARPAASTVAQGPNNETRRQLDRADQREQQQDQAGDGVPVPGLDQLGLEPLPKHGAVVAHRADQQSY